jgi:hypothetical protein
MWKPRRLTTLWASKAYYMDTVYVLVANGLLHFTQYRKVGKKKFNVVCEVVHPCIKYCVKITGNCTTNNHISALFQIVYNILTDIIK